MARDLNDALEKAFDDSYDEDDGEGLPEGSEEEKGGFLGFTKTSAIAAGAAGAVLLVAGLFIGATFLGGGGDTTVQRQSVTSVTERLPIFDQLESMRENTISTLNQQIADKSAELEKASASSSSNTAAAASAAVGKLHGDYTAAADSLIGLLVSAQVSCDDVASYLAGTYTGTQAEGLVTLGLTYSTTGDQADSGKEPAPVLAGSSPGVDTGKTCSMVSTPVLSTVSLTATGRDVDGAVCVAYAPVATDDSHLYNAVYVIGFANSGSSSAGAHVTSCRYAGLVESGDPAALQKAVDDASAGVAEALAG